MIHFIIREILGNEKYAGELLLGKKYKEDYISKKGKRNKGERPMYLVKNAHDPLISKEVFSAVQEEIERRANKHNRRKGKKVYQFTGIIRCAKCNHHYARRISNCSTPYAKVSWSCYIADKNGKSVCSATKHIPEDILISITADILGLTSLDNVDLHDYINEIVAEDFQLLYKLKTGQEVTATWQYKSRKKSWTPEMKEAARQKYLSNLNRKKEKENNHGS